MQQQNDAMVKDAPGEEHGTNEPSGNKLESDVILTLTQPDSNQDPVSTAQLSCTVRFPEGNGSTDLIIERPLQTQPDQSDDPLGRIGKENLRTKWFLQGDNSNGQRETTSPVIVNGDIGSACSSRRPSLESGKGSSQEINSNQLLPEELPLKNRKSLSDSLLCTVLQNDRQLVQNGDIRNGLSSNQSNQNINREHCAGDPKGKLSPNAERKQNYSKQNGSPFSHKKATYNNGPCCKHSDEELNNQRSRTTTHPCYDPMDLPKRRRNAACTVAILSPSDRASDNDFLETKI